MVELNLLHSRIEQSIYEHKILRQYLLAALVAALVMLIGSHVWLQIVNQQEQETVEHLRENIAAPVNPATLSLNDDNEFSAADILKVLLTAVKSDLNGVCYTQITRDGLQVNLQGNAWTMSGVSYLMQQISLSGLFEELHLLGIKQQKQNGSIQFNFTAREA